MTTPHQVHNLRQDDPDSNSFPVPLEPPTASRLHPSISNLHHGHLEVSTDLQADALQAADSFYATDPNAGNYFLYGSKSHHDQQLASTSQLMPLGRHAIDNTAHVDISGRGMTDLGSFGPQPWLATPGPFLGFASRQTYELTGELLQPAEEEEEEDAVEEEPHDGTSFANFDNSFAFPGHAVSPSQNPQVSPLQPQDHPSTYTGGDTNHNPPPYQQSLYRSALKRKAIAIDPNLSSDPAKRLQPGPDLSKPTVRTVSFGSMSAAASSSEDGQPSSELSNPSRGPRQTSEIRRGSTGAQPAVSRTAVVGTPRARTSRALQESSSAQPPAILPKEKVFPIQIGSELFRLSGASLSSDAPSYFTHFFEDQLRQSEESGSVRTLYIDRDPIVFREIARHLQGYHIKPVDGSDFVKLFADAQFYHLPRLIEQLFESEIFIQVGDRHFQIPKDIFSDAGNTPNFFSLGFAIFFSNPGDAFPGVDRKGLIRPPSITPPYVAGRSAEIFAELIQLLRGYPLEIQNETHRASLLRDCRYFHLRGLEQRLIAHEISYNYERDRSEISLRLEDIKPSGVSFKAEDDSTIANEISGWINYARPFVDDQAYELVVEIGGDSMVIDLSRMRVEFRGLTKSRILSLLQVIANKMNLPNTTPLGLVMLAGGTGNAPTHMPFSEDQIRVRFEEMASSLRVDGDDFELDPDTSLGRRLLNGSSNAEELRGAPATGKDVRDKTQPLSPPPLPRNTSSSGQTKRQPVRPASRPPVVSPAGSAAQMSSATSPMDPGHPAAASGSTLRKRRRLSIEDAYGKWIVRSGQWRLKIRSTVNDQGTNVPELIFVAVKVDAYTSEKARNTNRTYLGT